MYLITAHLSPDDSVVKLALDATYVGELFRKNAALAGVRLEHLRLHIEGSRLSVAFFIMAANFEEAEALAGILFRQTVKEIRHTVN